MTTIFTLGYTGVNPADLLAAAERRGLIVVDTRYSPRSANPDWRRPALMARLQWRYRWLQAFGNVNYNNDGPIKILDAETGIRLIRPTLEQGIDILLLCVCEHVETCHRRVVAEALSEATGLAVVHWTPADVKRAASMEGLL